MNKTLVYALLCLLLATSCKDDNSDKPVTLGDKEGVVLVTFGSSYEAPQETFKSVDAKAKAAFPTEEIRWGYTSDIILNKLRQGNGEGSLNGVIIDNNTPEECFEVMIQEGYSKFVVQSLHVIPGEEFDELKEAVEALEAKYPGVECLVGNPLLTSDEDIKAVAQIMAQKFESAVAEGPVCFMGHGTPHAADAQYLKLQTELQKINSNFFVGTVEGTGFEAGRTSIGGIIKELAALTPKPSKVTITPLMSIAGDHANNDMNGLTGETNPEEQSWRERLEGEGYQVTDVMKGLGDYDDVVALWMQHLTEAMN